MRRDIGIAVGVAGALSALAGAALWLRRRRRDELPLELPPASKGEQQSSPASDEPLVRETRFEQELEEEERRRREAAERLKADPLIDRLEPGEPGA
jgi:hypothetical protein